MKKIAKALTLWLWFLVLMVPSLWGEQGKIVKILVVDDHNMVWLDLGKGKRYCSKSSFNNHVETLSNIESFDQWQHQVWEGFKRDFKCDQGIHYCIKWMLTGLAAKK